MSWVSCVAKIGKPPLQAGRSEELEGDGLRLGGIPERVLCAVRDERNPAGLDLDRCFVDLCTETPGQDINEALLVGVPA